MSFCAGQLVRGLRCAPRFSTDVEGTLADHGHKTTDERRKAIVYKYLFHKELSGSFKSEILITIRLRQDYGGQEC